ncbi:hypothetical protein WOLCODRAFT_155474 [Wolfiporia cocos MD-104 SS10]|uniref:Protein kinase domain-containing protein n=1 Tax=Wolfiporia cocos (strain MD-104) TaxID=742152 RepID=A0A2H3J4W5_WOLCO|nr:hypothetical protein WOLCODRAFT_155474 [Wolfiporia cocos MD-104 SS10]
MATAQLQRSIRVAIIDFFRDDRCPPFIYPTTLLVPLNPQEATIDEIRIWVAEQRKAFQALVTLWKSRPRDAKLPLLVAHILKEPEDKTSKRKRNDQETGVEMDEAMMSELRPLVKRYRQSFRGKAPSPSVAAQPREYYNFQNGVSPILDGRYASISRRPPVAAPIVIYDPVFATFIANVNSSEPVDDDDLVRQTEKFMESVSEIRCAENESYTSNRVGLKRILEVALESMATDTDGPESDHIIPYIREVEPREAAALGIIEEKAEVDKSGDAAVQAEFYYRLYWSNTDLLDESFSSTFLIGLMGPYLSISGAIWTTEIVVQPLVSGLLWLGSPALISDVEIIRVARVFDPSIPPAGNILRRFFPLATSFTYSDKEVSFKYQKYLKSKSASCLVFSAILDKEVIGDEQQVVVKFVERYGKDAHELLAKEGLAPKLYYCGDIWHNDPVANKGCGSRKMIVMEYVQGRSATRTDCINHYERLSKAVKLLHDKGMVHGDLRRPNIIVTDNPDGPLKIIDFDWAGMQGEVRYPLRLSKEIYWEPSVGDYALIEYKHDDFMLRRLIAAL